MAFTSKAQAKKEIGSSIIIDTSKISIIPYNPISDCHKEFIKNTSTASNLTVLELEKIDEIFHRFIKKYNADEEKRYFELKAKYPNGIIKADEYVIDFSNWNLNDSKLDDLRFVRQYIPFKNIKGEKEVLINCLCKTFNYNWQREYVRLYSPPNNCYFNFKINLSTGISYDFYMDTVE